MRRIALTPSAVEDWVRQAYLHPNANWYVPVFDVRRRGLFYLTSRALLLVDEPAMRISPALERVLARFERRDPTLRVLRQMTDEERVRLALSFIASLKDRDERDAALRRLADRPSIVFGFRPGSLDELVEPRAAPAARAWRAELDRACDPAVRLELERIGPGPVYTIDLTG